uniref:Doublecortin domain containing 2B n=1 Tax=Anas zonorhyncha TaxID=75864 RepID=A0A8B9VQB5_9AVES
WAGGLTLAPPAKKVVVYRNGDPFFHGKKFVVNQRRFLTFEAFLKEVTRSIQAPLAVRNLYTPRHGHRIAELGDLQDGQQYVAAGFEKFKSECCVHGSCRNSGSWHALGCFCRSVFRNGDLLSPPFQLLFSQSAPLQWDTLLAVLTAKADLRSGAVNRLCRLDGTQVLGKEELVNGGYYVAVGAEEYKKLPYFELLVPQDATHRTPWYVGGTSEPRGSVATVLCVLESQEIVIWVMNISLLKHVTAPHDSKDIKGFIGYIFYLFIFGVYVPYFYPYSSTRELQRP